jgi:hypothetical protein
MDRIVLYIDTVELKQKSSKYSLNIDDFLNKHEIYGNIIELEIKTQNYMKIKSLEDYSKQQIELITSNKKQMFSMNNSKICLDICKIDDITLKTLKQQVYYVDDNGKHNEFGGALKFVKNNKSNKPDYFIVIDEKIKIMTGTDNETDVPYGESGYHTHPALEYEAQKVKYAWPSGDDYMAILDKMINEKTILHIVATKEGVYIVSFSENGIIKGTKFLKTSKNKKYSMKYKLELPNIKNDDFITPEKYIEKINQIPDEDKIFNVQFLTWEDASNEYFKFNYPKSYKKNCIL